MKIKMKQLFGILLSLVLTIGLMPGMSMMVYAADGEPSVGISPVGAGTVECVYESDEDGGKWTFTAKPEDGYTFKQWTYKQYDKLETSTANPYGVMAYYISNGIYNDYTAIFEPATIAVTELSLELSTVSSPEYGQTFKLIPTVSPENATDKTVTWMSSDENVAAVDYEGMVTPLKAGMAIITATATNGTDDPSDDKTATCTVTVVNGAAPSDSSDDSSGGSSDSGSGSSSGGSSDSGSGSSSGGSSDSGNTSGGTSSGSSDNTNTNTDTSAKVPYDDVPISTGSVNDITGTASATAESNPFGTKIENNNNLTTLLSLTDAEVAQGVNVWLDIQDMSSSVSKTDKSLIQDKSGDYTVGLYLDINLFKKVGSNDATKVTETNGKVKASIVIPESLWKSGRTFEIIRVHDGVATAIAGTYDENTHVFTFETDKFSTYALAYKDPASSSNSGTTSNSSSSNSSNSTQSTAPKTGDPNDIRVWYLLLIASLGGLGFLGYSKKKKVND